MKRKRWDMLLIAGILLTAGIFYCVSAPRETGGWAVVTIAGEEAGRYPLSEDKTVRFGEDDYNLLVIADGGVSVTEANCGDHTCVRTGIICRQGETIVCLPHRLVVEIQGGETPAFDHVTG